MFYPLSSYDVGFSKVKGKRDYRKGPGGTDIKVLCLAGGPTHCPSYLHLSGLCHTQHFKSLSLLRGPLSGFLRVPPEPFPTWLEVRRRHMALLSDHKSGKTRAEIRGPPLGVNGFLIILLSLPPLPFPPVPWLVLSEIFPGGIRGRAMALTSSMNWGINLLISLTFLTVTGKDSSSSTNAFVLLAQM